VQFRRQPRETEGVNLTPLIDVVFLLLIFFMVSTTFTKETHLSVDLPEAEGQASTERAEQVEILISAEGDYSVNGKSLVNNRLTTLKGALEEVAGGDNQRPLVITADAKASHETVVRAMDAAGQLGFVHLSISTRHPEASE
jgi:biopolymer transport protein ExbD